VSAVHQSGIDIERMLHVETAHVELDGEAAITEGLSVRLSQKFVEGMAQTVARHVACPVAASTGNRLLTRRRRPSIAEFDNASST
jgi:hypothetical protein